MVLSFPSLLPYAGTDSIRWFASRQQPIRRDFAVSQAPLNGRSLEIYRHDRAAWSFCALPEFRSSPQEKDRILLVAPLSGHFAFILREMVTGLTGHADVSVTDWFNASFVPLSDGDFGFDENIETIVDSIKLLGPDVHVIALCQGVVPALAATAVLAQSDPGSAPRSLVLMGGPVDPLANPTRVVNLLRQRSLTVDRGQFSGPCRSVSARRKSPCLSGPTSALGFVRLLLPPFPFGRRSVSQSF